MHIKYQATSVREFGKMKGILARAWTLLNLIFFSLIGQKSAEFLESTADYDAQSASMLIASNGI